MMRCFHEHIPCLKPSYPGTHTLGHPSIYRSRVRCKVLNPLKTASVCPLSCTVDAELLVLSYPVTSFPPPYSLAQGWLTLISSKYIFKEISIKWKSVGLRVVSPVSLAEWRLSHHQDSADAIVDKGEKSSAAARRVVLGPLNTESLKLSAMYSYI